VLARTALVVLVRLVPARFLFTMLVDDRLAWGKTCLVVVEVVFAISREATRI